MKRIRLTGLRYANLRKGLLRNRNLIYMESNGNCCWQVFDRKRFRGRRENIPLGFEGLPEREPKSIRRVECDEDFNNCQLPKSYFNSSNPIASVPCASAYAMNLE